MSDFFIDLAFNAVVFGAAGFLFVWQYNRTIGTPAR